MSSNPNPSRVTEPMWWFWEQFRTIEPTVQLGGIYAAKPGYHNTRDGNSPTNYSVTSTLDRQGPSDKGAAIDLTFPDAQAGRYATIIKYATRLLNSGKDPHDERGNYLREFYGQADGDLAVEGWDFQGLVMVSSDSSHLWHIHLSFIRAHLNDWKAFRAVLSILSGQTVEAWRAAEAGTAPNPEETYPMVELLILIDGPVPGGIYASSGAGLVHVTAAQAQAKIDRGMCRPGINPGVAVASVPLGKFTAATALPAFGPILDGTQGPKGDKGDAGPATLVPHTHPVGSTGGAAPTAG